MVAYWRSTEKVRETLKLLFLLLQIYLLQILQIAFFFFKYILEKSRTCSDRIDQVAKITCIIVPLNPIRWAHTLGV